MKLKVIGSSSKGNAYLLENENEALLIECGVNFSEIKKAVNFNISKIVGCILTHEHLDHSKAIKEVLNAGITVFATRGTHHVCNTSKHHRSSFFFSKGITWAFGGFKVMYFDVKHDATEPCGFLINHKETGNVLFLTDTSYCAYTFKNLNNIIIEANFSNKILSDKLKSGNENTFLRDRILKSHMSLETCIDHLQANDLKDVNNIILIHLSDRNSDEEYFKSEVKLVTSKNVYVADKGMEINFNKNPF